MADDKPKAADPGKVGDSPLLAGVRLYEDHNAPRKAPPDPQGDRHKPGHVALVEVPEAQKPPTRKQLEKLGYSNIVTNDDGVVVGYMSDTARTDPEPALVEHPVANPTESGTGEQKTRKASKTAASRARRSSSRTASTRAASRPTVPSAPVVAAPTSTVSSAPTKG